jgi:hypothetical protein
LKKKAYTHQVPQMRNAQIACNSAEFLLFIKAPDGSTFVPDLIADYLQDWLSRIPVAGLQRVIEVHGWQCQFNSYPVANITTSADSSDPFWNLMPFLVNRSMKLSFFNLILPSITSWLAPTSVLDVIQVSQNSAAHGTMTHT